MCVTLYKPSLYHYCVRRFRVVVLDLTEFLGDLNLMPYANYKHALSLYLVETGAFLFLSPLATAADI